MRIDSLKDTAVGWESYTLFSDPKLIYLVHRKCASTSYTTFFEKLGWFQTDTTQINWKTDIVFSHIKHPLKKHRKGIVEACSQMRILDLVLTNTKLLEFMCHVTSVDVHSFTIEKMIGEHATRVHWIPIDTDIDHKMLTVDFINQHGGTIPKRIEQWFLEAEPKHQSNVAEKTLYNLMMEYSTPSHILRYVDFDMCLYDQIITPPPHVLAKEYYQTRIKELLDQNFSQQQAEEIVDQEVYNNKHTTWKKNNA